MPNLSPGEFATQLGQAGPATPASTNAPAPASSNLNPTDFSALLSQAAPRSNGLTFPPATQAAIDRATSNLPKLDLSNYVGPEAAKLGVRPGHFLDIASGVDGWTRYDLGLDENRVNQFKVLARRFGPANVDMSAEGRFIIRNQGAGGKTDLMVDPVGLDAGDIEQIGSQALPLVAAYLGAKAGGNLGKTGLGKVLAASTGAALAGEGVGAVQDALVRLNRGDPLNLPELTATRAKMALADEALGIAAAGVTKLGSKTLDTVLGSLGIPMGESAQRSAAEAIQARTGVRYRLTPGQESGNRLLLRMEAGASSRPGSASAMEVVSEGQQQAEDELKRVFMDLPRTLTDEELATILPRTDEFGSRALRRLGTYADKLESDVAQAQRGVEAAGTTEAQQAAGVDLANPLAAPDVGRTLRGRVVNEYQSARSDFSSRYEAFLSRPEVQARSVVGDDIAKAAQQVEKDFVPAAERAGQTESLEPFVAAKFRTKLDALKDLKGANVSVNDLKRIRTALDNDIKEGIAIPGTDVAQLESLRSVVDDGITKALSNMPDKSLLSTWNTLRSDYSTFQQRFNRTGIREMLVPEGERGAIGNTAIAESISGNSPAALDHYNDLKAFFGASSPEFKQLQQLAKEQVLGGSIPRGGGYVQGSTLASRLESMRPEVATELFGTSNAQLDEIANVLRKSQGRLDLQELVEAAQGSTLTSTKVQALIDAEHTRAVEFNNRLVKAASKGTLNAERIDPREFVRYATQMPENEAQKVMNALQDASDPALVREMKQLAIEDLWEKVQAGQPGQKLASSTLIDKAMGDEAQQRTWRAIIGDNAVEGLKELAEVARNRDFAAQSYKGASQLAASSDVQRIFMKGEIGTIKEAASRFLVGFLYAGPLKRMWANLANTHDIGRVLNAVVASTPFVDTVARRFGPEGPAVMRALAGDIAPLVAGELERAKQDIRNARQ